MTLHSNEAVPERPSSSSSSTSHGSGAQQHGSNSHAFHINNTVSTGTSGGGFSLTKLLTALAALASALGGGYAKSFYDEHRAVSKALEDRESIVAIVDRLLSSPAAGDKAVAKDLIALKDVARGLTTDAERVRETQAASFSQSADFWAAVHQAGFIDHGALNFGLLAASGPKVYVRMGGHRDTWIDPAGRLEFKNRKGERCWLVYVGKADTADRWGFSIRCDLTQ